MPQRAAKPDRGWTKAAYPSGSAIARPVGSTARSPGASSASTVVTTSAPASPGSAYAGSGTPGSRRWTRTSTDGGEVGKVGDGTAGKVTPATLGAALAAEGAADPPVDDAAGHGPGQERRELGHAAGGAAGEHGPQLALGGR